MSRDKDVRTCLQTVLTAVRHDHIHFVQVAVYPIVFSLLCERFVDAVG